MSTLLKTVDKLTKPHVRFIRLRTQLDPKEYKVYEKWALSDPIRNNWTFEKAHDKCEEIVCNRLEQELFGER